jgi:acylaminoacyl-peptidase
VLEIHGGPHAQYGSGYFHEFQVLAAAGYAVFYSNPRGSKGYGRDHCAAIRGHWGTADWTDIQAVTRFMKSQPFVDASRLGIMGGSYGGYMTNWAIGHAQDFAAAITDRCVSNLVSMSGSTDVPERPGEYFPGNFWDQPEARWEQSPLKYLGHAKTPTLIIHSEGDLRCNVEQAEQVFAALKLLDVPTRLVRYPRSTSHGMSRSGPPDLRLHRLGQILAWWDQYLHANA